MSFNSYREKNQIQSTSKKIYSLIHPVHTRSISNPVNIFKAQPDYQIKYSKKPYHALNFCTQPRYQTPKSAQCVDINLLKYTDKNFSLPKKEETNELKYKKKSISRQQIFKSDVDKKKCYTQVKQYKSLKNASKMKSGKKSFSTQVQRLSLKKKMAKLKDSRPIVQKNQDFYDFKGLLGEINSKKNLQEQFGDRYFEFSLRDRYIDEKNKEHEYVYNLTKDNEPSKFLQKAKKLYPEIKQKRKLVLRGKHVKTQLLLN